VTTKYDAAVAELYRAPHDAFVAERKRLAKELGAAGDKSGAAMLAKLTRPSVSTWATNQLYARAQEPFDELFASAAKLREGDLEAGAEHRRLTAKLVARAADILKEAGHGASEGTLRRVSANLAALAAAGSFDPDLPGALSHDRDPPGFDVLAFGASVGDSDTDASTPAAASKHTAAKSRSDGGATPRHHGTPDADGAHQDREAAARAKAEAARAKAEAEAERRRAAEEQARVRTERRRLESALRAVKTDVERLTHERERLEGELKKTETELERALASERDLEERLAKLPDTH